MICGVAHTLSFAFRLSSSGIVVDKTYDYIPYEKIAKGSSPETRFTLSEWQEKFGEAARNKFPNIEDWNHQDRLLSILRQLGDVGGAIQKEQDIFSSENHAHDRPNHRIAALIADVLILCDKRGLDLDCEFREVLEWYQEKRA